MPRTAIVETATGAILVLDPPTREVPVMEVVELEGEETALVQTGSCIEVILPEGVECRVVEISDAQCAKFDAPDSRFFFRGKAVVAEKVPVDPAVVTAKAQRDADLALISEKAKDDPAFAAMARLIGVSPA